MDIVSHPFFKNMDWELVSRRAVVFILALCVLVNLFVIMIMSKVNRN